MNTTKSNFRALILIALLASGSVASADSDAGFQTIFDGKALDGWKAADMTYWSIEDGAITGKITVEHPLKENLYLIWQGGELADFELKLKSRITNSTNTNSGFQFRSKELVNHDVAGYQVDNQQGSQFLVRLYDEHGRHDLALRGQRTTYDESGKATKETIDEAAGPADFQLEQWHEYHLTCVGAKLTLKVNGKLMAEVLDNDPKNLDLQGILGLQLHSGGPTTVQFKDIRLKILKPASSLVKPQPSDPRTAFVLRDKTLVAWAAPADLTQRGGSVLTIDDQRGHFDGIVFGELTPAKWMAGSDFFSRTQQDQAAYPTETADPKTFVQLAIAYQGRQVTLYRNAKQYAQYTMAAAPQEYGPRSVVVIGQRHLAQGDKARFAGAIDDARIYDRALSAEEIAALKPNEAGGPKPWAWWTFDGKEIKDRTEQFLVTQLIGSKVEDGRLLLDGNLGMMLGKSGRKVPFVMETPAMPANVPAYWLTYHLAHPGPGGAFPGDPNCAFYWKGRYHLHYIYDHQDGCSFAHVSSTDMVHWKWHPTVLTPPTTGHGMYSGTGFITKEGQPAIIYHGQGSGRNQIAFALDDNLDQWTKPVAIEPKARSGESAAMRHWDPDCWLKGDTYYAISGGGNATLLKSPDLKNWEYLGLLLHDNTPRNLGVKKEEDISCANMFKIGDKWMLLCISHGLGCRYYLGDFKDEKFLPEFHGMMNWQGWDYFAPESLLTPDGRRVMWAWCNMAGAQTGIQALPRELSLPKDGVLRIKPLRELETLRFDERREGEITVKSGDSQMLKTISGDTVELNVTLKPTSATEYGVTVFCDADGKGFPITIKPESKTLAIGKIAAPFELRKGEDLNLRIFLDKGMVEVFANQRQAVAYMQTHPAKDVGIGLFSRGGDLVAKEVTGWKMKSIYR